MGDQHPGLRLQTPKASLLPQDLAHTIRKRLSGLTGFTAPKRPPHSFGVDHYAGQVRSFPAADVDRKVSSRAEKGRSTPAAMRGTSAGREALLSSWAMASQRLYSTPVPGHMFADKM